MSMGCIRAEFYSKVKYIIDNVKNVVRLEKNNA